jgi:hypothetical protein
MLDNPAVEWGIHIDRRRSRDVALPETMKRSMSRQAEGPNGSGGLASSRPRASCRPDRLAQAAATMADTPGALQLRPLETIVEVAAEKNSTLCCPSCRAVAVPENNTSLTSTLSATQSAVAKVTNASASSGRSGVADMAPRRPRLPHWRRGNRQS